jgi:outer membrane protein assembly factor BamB
MFAASLSVSAGAAEWQLRLPSATTLAPEAEAALILNDGTFLLSGSGGTRRLDAAANTLAAHSQRISGDGARAVLSRSGVSHFLGAFEDPQINAQDVVDPRQLCHFERQPWGDELAFAEELKGRFAQGARPDHPGIFGLYDAGDRWPLVHFGPDCNQWLVLDVLKTGQIGPDHAQQGHALALVTSHDGRAAFLRNANWFGPERRLFISRVTRDGIQWSFGRDIEDAAGSAAALLFPWTLEPTRDGGVLSFDGQRLERIDGEGQAIWHREVEHEYVTGGDPWEQSVGLDFWWETEPVLADLGTVVILEYSGRRFVFSPAGDLLADVALQNGSSPVAGSILPGSEDDPILRAQMQRFFEWQVSESGNGWRETESVSAMIWRFDANGQQRDILPPDSRWSNEGLLAEDVVLQRAADAAAFSLLDLGTGVRSNIESLAVLAASQVLGIHSTDSAVFLLHHAESGPLQLTKVAADGRRVWTSDVHAPLSVEDADHASLALGSAETDRAAFASNSSIVCAVFAADAMKLACADQADGRALFAPVVVHAFGQFLGGRPIVGVSPAELTLSVDSSNAVAVVSLADQESQIPFPLFQPLRMARRQFDASGALLSSAVVAGANAYGFNPVPVLAPSGTRLLATREQPEAPAREPTCSESTVLTQYATDGRVLSQVSLDGSWNARALSDDGRMLLLGCIDSFYDLEWRSMTSDGAELWRRPDAGVGRLQASAVTGGDWLLSNSEYLIRLSGEDGSERWRTALTPAAGSESVPDSAATTIDEASQLAFTRFRSRPHSVVGWSLSDGSPVAQLRTYQRAGSSGAVRPSATPALAILAGGRAVTAFVDDAARGLTVQMQRIRTIDQPDLQVDRKALRGYWHSDPTEGQGLALDFTSDGQLVVGGWFTYTRLEADDASEQRWYSVQGVLSELGAPLELQVFASARGRFATRAAEATEQVGRIRLALHECDALLMTYAVDAGELQGAQGAVQLRRTAGSGACTTGAHEPPAPTDGAWYNPETSGQGILIQTVPGGEHGQLVGGWFTFDPEGAVDDPLAQHWFTLLGTKAAHASVPEAIIYRTIGGAFDLRPTHNTHAVGRATFTAQSCANGTLSYRFDDSAVAADFAGLQGSVELSNLLSCAR